MRRPMRSSAMAAGATGVVSVVLVGGCATTSRSPVRLPQHASALQRAAPAAVRSRATPTTAPALGTAQRVRAGATELVVNVEHLADPLETTGVDLPPTSRAVGLIVSVNDTGGGTYDGSATTDFGLLARAPVTPLYLPSGPCHTTVEGFEAEILPGQLRAGCVAFSLPARTRILAVRFAPGGMARRLLWRVG